MWEVGDVMWDLKFGLLILLINSGKMLSFNNNKYEQIFSKITSSYGSMGHKKE